jgi:hypothetical protein
MTRKYITTEEEHQVASQGKSILKYVKIPWDLSERAVKQAQRMGNITLSAYIRMAVVKFTEEQEKDEREVNK